MKAFLKHEFFLFKQYCRRKANGCYITVMHTHRHNYHLFPDTLQPAAKQSQMETDNFNVNDYLQNSDCILKPLQHQMSGWRFKCELRFAFIEIINGNQDKMLNQTCCFLKVIQTVFYSHPLFQRFWNYLISPFPACLERQQDDGRRVFKNNSLVDFKYWRWINF